MTHRSTSLLFCFFLAQCLSLLFVFNRVESAHIRSRIESPSACLSLYMLDGAPGTPSADQQKEAADAAASSSHAVLLETRAAVAASLFPPPTSLIELYRSTQRTHLQNCLSRSSNGAAPCHKALPSALNLIKTHLKHEATKWFNDECDEMKDRIAKKASFTPVPPGGANIRDLVECHSECTESIIAMDTYLIQRDNAIKTILKLNIESLSEDEKKTRKQQCHNDMDKFKQEDNTVSQLWGACEGRIAALHKRLDTAVKQKFQYPNGFYDVLGLSKTATPKEINKVCDDKNNQETLLLQISGTGGPTEYLSKQMIEDVSMACEKLQNEDSRKTYDATEMKENVLLYDTLIGKEERRYVCEPVPKTCDRDEFPVLNAITHNCEPCPKEAPRWNALAQTCQLAKKHKTKIVVALKCPGMFVWFLFSCGCVLCVCMCVCVCVCVTRACVCVTRAL